MKRKTKLKGMEQCSFCFKSDKSVKLFSLRYLCKHLKIEFKQLFFECLKKAGSEHDMLEVKTDLDKAEVNLCSGCGKMIEKLTELFQCLEKIQMEVDWWFQGIREVISKSEKKSECFTGEGEINYIWAEMIKEVRRSVVDKPTKLSTLKPTLRLERCMEYSDRAEAGSGSNDISKDVKVEAGEEVAEMDADIFPLDDYGGNSDNSTPEDRKQTCDEVSDDNLYPPREDTKNDEAPSNRRRRGGRKKFPNEILYNRNAIRVKGSKQIKCMQCSRTYAERTKFQRHFRNAHIKKKMYQYQCHLCPAQYALHGPLNNHLIEEHGAQMDGMAFFQCDIGACEYNTYNLCLFKKHQLKCNGKRKKMHQRAMIKEHQCEFCEEKFNHEGMLKRHKRLIHKEEVQKKEGKAISNAILLEREGGRRKVQCKLCQAILIDVSGFHTHFRATHSGETHQCHLCVHKSKMRSQLYRHLRSVHNVEPVKQGQLPEEFKCDNGDCNYTTRDKHLMANHQITCQGLRREEKVVKFNCDICGKGFGTEFHMKLHKSRVHPKKVYKCDECGKVVKMKATLQQHIRSIHLKIRYNCGHIGCDKTFATKNMLSLHRRICEKPPPPTPITSSEEGPEELQLP